MPSSDKTPRSSRSRSTARSSIRSRWTSSATSRSRTGCGCPTCAPSRSAIARKSEGNPFQELDDTEVPDRQVARGQARLGRGDHDPAAVQGRDRHGRARLPGRRRRDGRARLRPLPPHDALAQAAHVPEPDDLGHRHEASATTAASASAPTAAAAPLDFVLQHNETDWEFVWRLAKRIGFELTVDDTRGEFKKPDPNAEAVELSYPDDLHTFRPRITAVQQVEKVNVRGFDIKAKQKVEKTATRAAAGHRGRDQARRRREGVPRRLARDRRPVVRRPRARRRRWRSRCSTSSPTPTSPRRARCQGDPRIKAGAKLKISGVGSKFSGTYRVAKAVHAITGGGGYTTSFSNSVGEHTILGQAGGGNSGAELGRLDRGRHRDQQQRSRQAGPREGQVPLPDRAGELLGPGPPPLRRQGARPLDAAGRRASRSWWRSRTATRRSPTCSARCSTARTRRARRWRSTTARSR